MLSLVNDLLGISKINSMHMTLEKNLMDITPLLKEEGLGESIIAKQKDIELIIDIEPQLPKVNVDPRRISEVLQNLLSNAIKFTERGQKVYLKAWHQDDDVLIEIKDEGQGIPKEEIPKLFNSFENISTKATEGEASTGLGLSIVKKLVELHDGTVSVKSKKDHGSTFTVSIPMNTP
jgi:signal transduction histidine kinase